MTDKTKTIIEEIDSVNKAKAIILSIREKLFELEAMLDEGIEC